ncbi:MAG: Ig-like domain-containing protein [Myxococcales bacterium]|nr:Ig-like domain-containing protein [Myxococcales bacterium]
MVCLSDVALVGALTLAAVGLAGCGDDSAGTTSATDGSTGASTTDDGTSGSSSDSAATSEGSTTGGTTTGGATSPTTSDSDSDATTGTSAGTTEGTTGGAEPYPEPDAWGPNQGPGGPQVAFSPDQLYQHCAYLDGGMDGDLGGGEKHDTFEHHNHVQMFDGYLLMPWAPEFGLNSGITFYDVSDPCAPVAVGSAQDNDMRESHSLGFAAVDGRWYMAANYLKQLSLTDGGILIWDITDPKDAKVVSKLKLPGFLYPDAYKLVTLSVFWQYPWLYVAGADNGVYVVDASDPQAPKLAHQYKFDPILRAGQVSVVGDVLMVTAAEGTRTALLDVSEPDFPQPIPGGDFDIEAEAYFSNLAGGYGYYARKQGGGGVLVWDLRDPQAPKPAGDYLSDGNGGYVFIKDEFAFVGESNFASIYDLSDLGDIKPVTQMHLTGDLDTITPIGNVVVLAVDDKSEKDKASAIAPWQEAVDTKPPTVTWSVPAEGGAVGGVRSRVGVTFSEFVDIKSVHAGSVRLYEAGMDPAEGRVDGDLSVQELIVNFAPREPLKPATEYTLEIPAGGVVDYNGNAIAESFTLNFKTGG